MNRTTFTGRLTRDPELRELPDGTPVCSLRIAVDQMGRANSAGYINVTEFGPSGRASSEVLAKGWLVAVDGRLDYNEWTTDDGKKRSAIEAIGRVEFLAAPKDTPTPADPVGAAA